jgi:hypothetical protein
MDFKEKAVIRIKHWLNHTQSHIKDYETFALELEKAGLQNSAGYIREMIGLTVKSNACLQEALNTLS